MPPKKTKPNAPCPCGSGKKHKKCCMIAKQLATTTASAPSSSSPTAILDEVMEVLASTTTTPAAAAVFASDIGPCPHIHFRDGVAYKDVLEDYLSIPSSDRSGRAAFVNGRLDYFTDLDFANYICAVCRSMDHKELCQECNIIFPRERMMKCSNSSGCKIQPFCGIGCLSVHKERCLQSKIVTTAALE